MGEAVPVTVWVTVDDEDADTDGDGLGVTVQVVVVDALGDAELLAEGVPVDTASQTAVWREKQWYCGGKQYNK